MADLRGAPPTRGLLRPKIFSMSCGFWNFGKIVGWRTSWRVGGKSWNRPWIGSCPFGIGAPPGKSRVRHCAGPHPPDYQPWSRDWEVVGGGRRIWLGYMRCMKVIDHNHGNRCDGCYSNQHEHSPACWSFTTTRSKYISEYLTWHKWTKT